MMKDLSFLKTYQYAHRGLFTKDQKVPENSLLAFKKALEKGYAIELDLNITKDFIPVSFHDFNLKRLCGIDQNIDEITYNELQKITYQPSLEKIATLREVLELVDGKMPLLIELKPHGNVIKLCESVMKELKDYKGLYAIFSFHPSVVYWFKKHEPDVIRGQISETFKDQKLSFIQRYLLRTMFFNLFTKPDFISYGIHDLPYQKLDRLKKKGMTIISYAARSQAQYDFVRSRYDNVVFEFFLPKDAK
ncbi:MAG: glycerophosphodiester phosphodiesterase [Tenericutes bacterium HGW-Tenericutes-6]|nr:MAG: glycerophosphodiester phosphodiesterase [Tenericutes bacterium HGW-Tenericutes-6]